VPFPGQRSNPLSDKQRLFSNMQGRGTTDSSIEASKNRSKKFTSWMAPVGGLKSSDTVMYFEPKSVIETPQNPHGAPPRHCR